MWLSCAEPLKPCSEDYKEAFTNPTIFTMIVRLLVGALDGEATRTHLDRATYVSYAGMGVLFSRPARTSSRSRLAPHACWRHQA